MKTQSELRAFMCGLMAGLVIVIGCFAGVSYVSDVKWQPIAGKEWRRMQADKHYGCSRAQQDPATGECQ